MRSGSIVFGIVAIGGIPPAACSTSRSRSDGVSTRSNDRHSCSSSRRNFSPSSQRPARLATLALERGPTQQQLVLDVVHVEDAHASVAAAGRRSPSGSA